MSDPQQDASSDAPEPGTALTVIPQVQATELVARLSTIREAMQTAMTESIDYGTIPGANKPSLFKPGAEKLGVLFQLDVQFSNDETWGPDDHLTVRSHATVYHAPTGLRLGQGDGLCSTRESRYAYRTAQRVCPACGVAAIIKGKAEYGGGWVCFKKKDGCGAKFDEGDPAITGQVTGQIANPDLPDLWNTVLKMAEKRARVDAILAATAASALFTQDVEDQQPAARAADDGPRYGAAATSVDNLRRALAYLLSIDEPVGHEDPPVEALLSELNVKLGYLPQGAVTAIVLVARAVRALDPAAAAQAAQEAAAAPEPGSAAWHARAAAADTAQRNAAEAAADEETAVDALPVDHEPLIPPDVSEAIADADVIPDPAEALADEIFGAAAPQPTTSEEQ